MTNDLPWGDAPLVSLEELLDTLKFSINVRPSLLNNPTFGEIHNHRKIKYMDIKIQTPEGLTMVYSQEFMYLGASSNIDENQIMFNLSESLFYNNVDVFLEGNLCPLFNYQKNYIKNDNSNNAILTINIVLERSGFKTYYVTLKGSNLVAKVSGEDRPNNEFLWEYDFYKKQPTLENAKFLYNLVKSSFDVESKVFLLIEDFLSQKAKELYNKYEKQIGAVEND